MTDQPDTAKIDRVAALQLYLTPKENNRLRSYRDIAEELGVPHTTLADIASEEKWPEQRERNQRERLEAYKQAQITDQNKAVERHLEIWRNVQTTSIRLLNKISKKIEDEQTTESILLKNPERSLSLALNNVASALDRAITGERLAMGLPTTIAKSEVTERKAELTDETIQAIDKLFEKNYAPAEPSPTNT